MNYSICISGAAAGKTVQTAHAMAEEIGRAVAKAGHITTTGATVGLPFFAARAAQQAGGVSIGFSPAASLKEHVFKYRLPIGVYDFINFTGMHYVGRDVHLVQSSDAVITIGGRIGSLHEFTTALESAMPCGILLGSGGAADMIPNLLSLEPHLKHLVVTDTDPVKLVEKVIKAINKDIGDIDTKALAHDWFVDGHLDSYHRG